MYEQEFHSSVTSLYINHYTLVKIYNKKKLFRYICSTLLYTCIMAYLGVCSIKMCN